MSNLVQLFTFALLNMLLSMLPPVVNTQVVKRTMSAWANIVADTGIVALSGTDSTAVAASPPILWDTNDPTSPSSGDWRLQLAISEFQSDWQNEWHASEEERRRTVDFRVTRTRFIHAQCMADVFDHGNPRRESARDTALTVPDPQYLRIRSRVSYNGVCPTWMLSPAIPEGADETMWRDGAIMPGRRAAVAGARARLLVTLREAWSGDQSNGWLTGQLVRFLTDADSIQAAASVAQECSAEKWWCHALAGFVSAREGNTVQAGTSYGAMRAAMPDSLRCAWSDVSMLLEADAQKAYGALSCAARDSLHEQLWWLSDPMFRIAGNERLVEQETRRMEIALRRATGQDERFRYDVPRGGDALTEMIQRYGWPTYTSWTGATDDNTGDNYRIGTLNAQLASPYTTFEYTPGRIRTIPSWRAVADPFSATVADWGIITEDEYSRITTAWWPLSHFRPTRRVVQLPQGQVAFMRRQNHTDVWVAVPLTHPALIEGTAVKPAGYDVMLLASTGPASVDSLDQQIADGDATAVLTGTLTHQRALLAVEAIGAGNARVDARARFAVTAPPILADMSDKEVSISSIALLEPLPAEVLREPSDALLHHMLPGLKLAADARKVTLYWEYYGLGARDSARVQLSVVDDTTGGGAVSKADRTEYVDASWNEADARLNAGTMQGPVPLKLRAIALDLGNLKAGRYSIQLLVTLNDGSTRSAETSVELLP